MISPEVQAVVDLLPQNWQVWSFRGVRLWQWAGVGVSILLAAGVGHLASLGISHLSGLRHRLATNQVSRSTSRSVRKSTSYLVAVFVLDALLKVLGLQHQLLAQVMDLTEVVVWTWFLSSLWDFACDHYASRHDTSARAVSLALPFLQRLVRAGLWVAAGMTALAVLGYDVRAVVAGLGIGGIAVALASKDSLENLFGAVTIMADLPFGVGDWVRIGDVEGVVEEINLRSTRIRTFEDSLVTMPNSTLIRSSVNNFGMRRNRRIRFTLFLDPTSSPEAVKSLTAWITERFQSETALRPDSAWAGVNEVSLDGLQVVGQAFFEIETFPEEVALKQAILLDAVAKAHELGLHLSERVRPH